MKTTLIKKKKYKLNKYMLQIISKQIFKKIKKIIQLKKIKKIKKIIQFIQFILLYVLMIFLLNCIKQNIFVNLIKKIFKKKISCGITNFYKFLNEDLQIKNNLSKLELDNEELVAENQLEKEEQVQHEEVELEY